MQNTRRTASGGEMAKWLYKNKLVHWLQAEEQKDKKDSLNFYYLLHHFLTYVSPFLYFLSNLLILKKIVLNLLYVMLVIKQNPEYQFILIGCHL